MWLTLGNRYEQMETKIVLISLQIFQFNILKIQNCDSSSFRILETIKQEKNGDKEKINIANQSGFK